MSEEIRAWYEQFKRNEQKQLQEQFQEQLNQARKDGLDQGINQGISQGINQGERALLLRQLRTRFGNIPASMITRIEAADVTLIERWGDRVLSAQTLAEVFVEPN
jgi:flagellar biosynthesis/type III secretory pathway protein FliH